MHWLRCDPSVCIRDRPKCITLNQWETHNINYIERLLVGYTVTIATLYRIIPTKVFLSIFSLFSAHCQTLPSLAGGTVELVTSGTITQANSSCNIGYTMIGESLLTCSSNGDWDHSLPTCSELLL